MIDVSDNAKITDITLKNARFRYTLICQGFACSMLRTMSPLKLKAQETATIAVIAEPLLPSNVDKLSLCINSPFKSVLPLDFLF